MDKIPPQSIEAESALLGSMILDWHVIGDVSQIVTVSDFYKTQHAVIYEVLIDCYTKNIPIDMVQLNEQLRDRGVLDQVGGISYIIEIGESVPSSSNAPHYAKIVRDKALKRSMIELGAKIVTQSHESPSRASELLDSFQETMFKIAELSHDSGQGVWIADVSEKRYSQIEANSGKGYLISGVKTDYVELDDMLAGLQNREMIVLAGRPSSGKTALCLNVAENIASRGEPVVIFSLEMDKEQLHDRLLCTRAGVDLRRVRTNHLGQDDYAKLIRAHQQIKNMKIIIDDSKSMTMATIRSKARQYRLRYGIVAVFIDYLQKIQCPQEKTIREKTIANSGGIKAMASELGVPVVCLAQLNRGPENREDHRPRMSDLQESGSIEQDADVVILIHREEYFHLNDPSWIQKYPEHAGVAELIISKQRNGPTGLIKMQWDATATRFNNLAHSQMPNEQTQQQIPGVTELSPFD